MIVVGHTQSDPSLRGVYVFSSEEWLPARAACNEHSYHASNVRDDGATSSLWWATKNEWLGLIDVAGLEVEALYGDFDRSPLTDRSREYVFIAKRK